jgi:ribosomal silencing factor RsfS
MDFGDMVVNIFAETARSYYDLDRLYRDARLVDIPAAPQTAPAAAAVRPRK